MARHDDVVSLRQMFSHAREASGLVAGKVRADLDRERVLVLALVQLLQILGEAARRVSEPGRRRHPRIPWGPIVALRNRLIHGYDAFDYDAVWEIVSKDLPTLSAELERILSPSDAAGGK